jgi:hypothetical protein
MQYCIYKVDDRPYCCWEDNLIKRNLEFINSIDTSYFRYTANIHATNLDSENKQNAAFALRQIFHHVLETMFTIICASLQAPKCIYGWIQKSEIGDVRKIIKSINRNDEVFNVIGLSNITWEKYFDEIFYVKSNPNVNIKEISNSFAKFLNNISSDFLDDYCIKEYNSFKHGFRLRPGGFKFAIGPQKEKDQVADPKDMMLIGNSVFGSSFFTLEKINDLTSKSYPHYQSRYHALNWYPENLIPAINTSSFVIENILAFLRIRNGVNSVEYKTPEDLHYLELPWQKLEGMMNMNFDIEITKEMIDHFTKDEIDARLNKIWKGKKNA